MSSPAPHGGHTPRLPAKNALTFNLCEHVGQWNLIPIILLYTPSLVGVSGWPLGVQPVFHYGPKVVH